MSLRSVLTVVLVGSAFIAGVCFLLAGQIGLGCVWISLGSLWGVVGTR